jgi:hypothetical protein
VLGALDGPVAHLALNDAWVLPLAAVGERLGEDLGDRLLMRASGVPGGKIPAECGLSGARRGGCG